MGGNRYTNRRLFTDAELDSIVTEYKSQQNSLQSPFTKKIYTDARGWKTGLSYHFDSQSLRRFIFKLQDPSFCHNCQQQLLFEDFGSASFNKYCKLCADNGVWRQKSNISKEKLESRGIAISRAKTAFYKTEKGKLVAKTNGKKISKKLIKHFQTEKGHLQKSRSSQYNSKAMKEKILLGKFTPMSNNRRTHWDSFFAGKKYRSSWEAMYQYYNLDDEYETLRILYTFENKEHVYIVDFVNHTKKTVAEVKPAEFLKDKRTLAKINALKVWANKNCYMFILADQSYFRDKGQPSNMEGFDFNTCLKIKNFYR